MSAPLPLPARPQPIERATKTLSQRITIRQARLVEKLLDELDDDDPREPSAVIAARLGISEPAVDHTMRRLIREHRTRHQTLRCAVLGGLDEAERSGEDIYTEEPLRNGFGKPVRRAPRVAREEVA